MAEADIKSFDELKHIRRGHLAHVTAVCNTAKTQIRDKRSKATLTKTCDALDAALKSLEAANDNLIAILESEESKVEELSWLKVKRDPANEMMYQIGEYLSRSDVKSKSSIKVKVGDLQGDEADSSESSQYSIRIKTEQAKLKVTQAAESAKLASKIADLQAQQKKLEAHHIQKIAELEQSMYQDILEHENCDKSESHRTQPVNVNEWLDNNVKQEPLTPLDPLAPPFIQNTLDSWIDDLIEGQETFYLQKVHAGDSLTKAIVRLESERDLPQVQLPTFNGDAVKWPLFIEQFYYQVHARPGITDIRRMDLLQAHLGGEAKGLVQGLGYSGKNYALALKELKRSFGHRIKVARALVDQITVGPFIPCDDSAALRRFYVSVRDCITTLHQLGYESDLKSPDTLMKTARRLPADKVARWNEYIRAVTTNREPNLSDLCDWLKDRVDADLNPFAITNPKSSSNKKLNSPARDNKFREKHILRKQVSEEREDSTSRAFRQKVPCALCSEAHYIYKCPMFANKTVQDRKRVVSEHNLCFNCLKPSHRADACFSTISCKERNCGKRHHTLLHYVNSQVDEPFSDPVEAVSKKIGSHIAKVFFQVVPINAYGSNGRVVRTYALLDSASDVSLINEDLVKDLGLQGEKKILKVTTYNGISTENTLRVSLDIKSSHDLFENKIHVKKAWAVPSSVFYCPPQNVDPDWEHIRNLHINDIDPKQINMLIGLDVPKAHLQLEVIPGKENEPLAVKTHLGWSLMGVAVADSDSNQVFQARINLTLTRETHLNKQIEQFWKTESFGVTHDKTEPYSVEDRKAETILDSSTKFVDGHYEISMLWKSDAVKLPDNHATAERRFQLLVKRLMRDLHLQELYSQTLNGYIANGQAKKLEQNEISTQQPRSWYLPHHGVVNQNKPGKVRVVFDAASQHMGTSLNDNLMTGPDLVNGLFGILQRFRLYKVALTADIEGMYHQVTVPDIDSHSLKFLWKEDLKRSGPPDVYCMKVHIFGAADSSSCANYAVKRTAIDNADKFDSSVTETVLKDFYVDDLLKSVQSEGEAIHLSQEITNLMQLGGFRLHKWVSNSIHVLESLPEGERGISTKDLDFDEPLTQRALGLKWKVNSDCLIFKPDPKKVCETKRGVISIISSIFDPCGYLAPYIFRAKCLIQELWKRNIDWDEFLSPDLLTLWKKWFSELHELASFELPRHHENFSSKTLFNEIHVFADASESGFGACAYLRYGAKDSETVVCSFLAAKTRVAPLKPALTIPRLELQGAVLAVRLCTSLQKELPIAIERVVFWSDSNTVLQYLNNKTKRFKPFVANRVAEILDNSEPVQWRHVPSENNPADYCTRGLHAKEHTTSHPWLRGPAFLWQDEHSWPDNSSVCEDDLQNDPEVKKTSFKLTSDSCAHRRLSEPRVANILKPEEYSSWTRLCRLTAWILRAARNFLSNLKGADLKPMKTKTLSVEECEEAKLSWIQEVQRQEFPDEFLCLKSGRELSSKSKLLSLTPFFDGKHIRVGGRIRKAQVPVEAKHQLLLPHRHSVSKLLMDHVHRETAHGGPEHVISSIRQEFWPINARKLAKCVIHECCECRRRMVRPTQPNMADLPSCRVSGPSGAFCHTGIDYFGPLYVKSRRSRLKRWGCLFTCLSTRAVHIELADSLETDDFILVLRNFLGRRGKPQHLYSDNGTNFRGAYNELRQGLVNLNNTQITNFLSVRAVQWHFNPPQSPHFGGAWERLVRSTKTALNAVLKGVCVQESVCRTTLIEIEAVLNSRPLTYNSTDANDFTALTPNHFLLGRTNPCHPVDCFDGETLSTRKRWRQTQLIADHFSRRWLKEYLPSLTLRHRWRKNTTNVSVGNLVLLVEDSKPRGQWSLGRITEIFPGDDGLVRTVRVKTPLGEYTRPAVKVCVLEEDL